MFPVGVVDSVLEDGDGERMTEKAVWVENRLDVISPVVSTEDRLDLGVSPVDTLVDVVQSQSVGPDDTISFDDHDTMLSIHSRSLDASLLSPIRPEDESDLRINGNGSWLFQRGREDDASFSGLQVHHVDGVESSVGPKQKIMNPVDSNTIRSVQSRVIEQDFVFLIAHFSSQEHFWGGSDVTLIDLLVFDVGPEERLKEEYKTWKNEINYTLLVMW